MSKRDLVLFIHGLGGSAAGSWGRFPELLRQDPALQERFAVDFFTYPTSVLGSLFSRKPKIQSLADALNTEIRVRHQGHAGLFLVCHSLGGIIARRWMDQQFRAEERAASGILLKGAIFYATPHNGAQLANVASILSFRNFQLKQLCEEGDFLDLLNEAWLYKGLQNHYRSKYVIGLLDDVVPASSGRPAWATDHESIAACDHRSIVKPADANATAFLILKQFLLQPPPQDSLRAMTREADDYRLAQRPAKARQLYEDALLEARSRHDPANQAYALRGLGHLETACGRYPAARRAYRQALALYESLEEEPLEIGHVLRGLADLNDKEGQYEEARRALQKADQVFARHAYPAGQRNVRVNLGHLESHLGNFEAARQAYEGALAIRQEGEPAPKRAQAHAWRGLGDLACAFRRKELAAESYAKALALYDGLKDRRGRANVLEGQGRLALRFGDPAEAGRCLDEALRLYEAAEDRLGESLVHLDLAELRLSQEILDQARRELRAAEIGYEGLNDLQGQAELLLVLGRLEQAEERPDEARRALHAALVKFESLDDRVGRARVQQETARLAAAAGEPDRAKKLLAKALASFAETRDEAGAAEVRLAQARLLRESDPAEAESCCRSALAAFTKLGLAAQQAEAERLSADLRKPPA